MQTIAYIYDMGRVHNKMMCILSTSIILHIYTVNGCKWYSTAWFQVGDGRVQQAERLSEPRRCAFFQLRSSKSGHVQVKTHGFPQDLAMFQGHRFIFERRLSRNGASSTQESHCGLAPGLLPLLLSEPLVSPPQIEARRQPKRLRISSQSPLDTCFQC